MKAITNPYIVSSSFSKRGYDVLFRYLLRDKIQFTLVCSCPRKDSAEKLQRLLNANMA